MYRLLPVRSSPHPVTRPPPVPGVLTWEDRSGLTPIDAQKAGRDRLPYMLFSVEDEDRPLVHGIHRVGALITSNAVAFICDDQPRLSERPNPTPSAEATLGVGLRPLQYNPLICVPCGNYACFRINIVSVSALCTELLTT